MRIEDSDRNAPFMKDFFGFLYAFQASIDHGKTIKYLNNARTRSHKLMQSNTVAQDKFEEATVLFTADAYDQNSNANDPQDYADDPQDDADDLKNVTDDTQSDVDRPKNVASLLADVLSEID